jgi:hypothetical protein
MLARQTLDGGVALEMNGLVVSAPGTVAAQRQLVPERTRDKGHRPFRLEMQALAGGELMPGKSRQAGRA